MSNNFKKALFFICLMMFTTLNSYPESGDEFKNYYESIKELKPGINFYEITFYNQNGSVFAYLLKVDLNDKSIDIKTALADRESINSKDNLSDIVRENMAFAGINANYFDLNAGNPFGALISNYIWYTGPIYNRAGIGFSKDKDVVIDKIKLIGKGRVIREKFKKKKETLFDVNCFNTPRHILNELCFFDPRWVNTIETAPGDVVLFIEENKVKKIKKEKKVNVPVNGTLLIGEKKKIESFFAKGDYLEIRWETLPSKFPIKEAISGGPFLVKDGMIFIDEQDQRINLGAENKLAPRTAIGIDDYNNLYLVVVDGRQGEYSVGITLEELANLLLKFKVKDAINLDGGGSSEMIVDGKIVNKPSEGKERQITNGLVLILKEN